MTKRDRTSLFECPDRKKHSDVINLLDAMMRLDDSNKKIRLMTPGGARVELACSREWTVADIDLATQALWALRRQLEPTPEVTEKKRR